MEPPWTTSNHLYREILDQMEISPTLSTGSYLQISAGTERNQKPSCFSSLRFCLQEFGFFHKLFICGIQFFARGLQVERTIKVRENLFTETT